MTSGLLLKGAALVVFLGVLGGATYGVQTFLGDGLPPAIVPAPLQADAPRSTLNATGGQAVTFPLVLQNRGDVAASVSVRAVGEGIEAASGVARVPAKGNATVFLTLPVPAGAAPGERAIAVSLLDGEGAVLRERAEVLTLRVLGPGKGFGEGDTAAVRYTGRLASGKVFDTNDPFVNVLNLPATEQFRPHGSDALMVEHDRPQVIRGFVEGLVGMQAGESRTVTFPPEKGYGPATVPQEVDREETLERVYVLDLQTDAVGRDVFDEYVNSTSQGQGSDFEPGDVFRFEQGPNRWPYRITSISAERVGYRLAVDVGERYTLYPFWEGASEVVEVNETHVRFVTTPTTAVGSTFTMRSYWPNMTTLVSATDDALVVRHSPPVGFKYTQPATQFEGPADAVVQEVREDVIVVGVRSSHPLAGETLTFDVEVLAITR
ncbi:MAG TPA: FKBP-type peptidyl-prolyl cis-trans isomerase [Candidatus Thermoplasmatota archaeon]|nr:FKBP-type peptidyl-prolyl cis-trans isomerase [Candidatus Thermoplasmatota archaeon]